FKIIEAGIRRVEDGRLAAEPSHLAALRSFAERAYRRPLTTQERDDLVAFYRSLRTTDGLTHEQAVRESVVSVLMSPHFCYRLDFRRFEEHNAVDRERFPGFTDELRSAMFEEPVRFFVDLVRSDRSVLDCLYGNHTFANAALARHYRMPEMKGGQDEWVRVDD